MAYYADKVPGRTITINGVQYLYFGGTSYLGVQSDAGFQELLLQNIRTYGFHHGASRNSNLQLEIYDRAEQYLAHWAGSPSALTVSSGFLAGQMISAHFSTEEYCIFKLPNAHAALNSPNQAQYKSFAQLAGALKAHIAGGSVQIPVVFMDSIDFSGESYPDYVALQSLSLDQIILVADDSHGLGLLGANGSGAYRRLAQLPVRELLVCGSLGKAMGMQGGLVLGTAKRVGHLRESAFFAGASPPSPASMATIAMAGAWYAEKRTSLLSNVALFEAECQYVNRFSHIKNYPVYGFDNTSLTSFLFTSGILVTDFAYPSAQAGTLPGRIVLSAHHTVADIKLLAGLLNSYYGR